MGKLAFVFSGQGAQYPGMGKELYEVSAAARQVFDLADKGRPETSSQCFSGTKEELMRTINTQPCVYCVDLAAAESLREAGIVPDGVAGFSLGEVAALTFAGAFEKEEGFRLVCRRAELMEAAASQVEGAMAAVLKLSAEQVEDICNSFSEVYPVNYNSPVQTVVAMTKDQLPAVSEAIAAAGGRAMPLAVGGGFHSPFMNSAAEQLAEELAGFLLRAPEMPVYANQTASCYSDDEAEIKATLAAQINHPVRWQRIIEQMIDDGFDTFIEVGPGKTLSGLIGKISKEVTVCQVENAETLKKALEAIK